MTTRASLQRERQQRVQRATRSRGASAYILGLLLLVAVSACAGSPGAIAARGNPSALPTPRLYVLDRGRLTGQNLATYELPDEPRDMSVPCFLVVHRDGTLLWEAGLGDRFVGGSERPRDPGWRISRTLRGQLAELGYAPEDITFFAVSHSHNDHVGNANDYAGSVWLVQEAERNAMFATGRNTAAYAALATSETRLLHGDHDVFGDGTVVIKSTPGHTPGHQSLLVKLARTGPILLSGDLYHYPEQLGAQTFPRAEFDRAMSAASRAAIQRFLTDTGTTLWIGHDIRTIDPLAKAPAFYD